ncbi:MAG: T9SS type A sorting domain-containing protein [Bacteroidales bacterium]|nr:T9SS type A sorting domain-containing protein [Bacteroidales bacterium]MBN2763871.1 T9SS type A sorting domain-containing protein [Bacteroidales bacterium]
MKRTIYWICSAALLLTLISQVSNVKGQQLIGLTENQQVKKEALKHGNRKKSTAAVLSKELPFFEDFSDITIYPDQEKWTDINAFVNTSFPDLPPSIGVATLDAIDPSGNVYAVNDRATPSDTLTSIPFNLLPYKEGNDEVLLSFFYQAGGKGELPDPQDSLVLEFFSPQANEWNWAWKASADSAGPFIQKILTIPKSLCEDGFRFRFRNYTSMSPNEVVGKHGALSNVDQWHIDYIMLNTMPRANHQSINDIAFVDPLTDLLFDYTTVPWHHLDYAQRIGRNKVRYVIRNLEKADTAISINRSYVVRNMFTGEVSFYEVYTEKIEPNSLFIRNDPFDHSYAYSADTDEGEFEVTAYLKTHPSQFLENDTVKYKQLFSDYYAYDDGTAEFGFGISGESTAGAMMACRFPVFRQDTIRGVDIFFNKTRNNYTADLTFNLCIWKNDGGIPGDTLYVSQEELTPDVNTGLLEFTRYRIPLSHEIMVDDTVFVGIKQLTEDFINIGYDVSHDNRSNILVNITGSWYAVDSLDPGGSLMMRPVFSTRETASDIADFSSAKEILKVFPNPVNERLQIILSEKAMAEGGRIQIYDITGHQVLAETLKHALAVSHLKSGIYILKITLQSGETLTSKLIISR